MRTDNGGILDESRHIGLTLADDVDTNSIIQQQDGGKGNPTPPTTNTVAKIAVIGKLAEAAEIFDDNSAAQYIGGVTSRAVRSWRVSRGLPFLKITNKVIRIRKGDLDRWLASRRVAITKGAV